MTVSKPNSSQVRRNLRPRQAMQKGTVLGEGVSQQHRCVEEAFWLATHSSMCAARGVRLEACGARGCEERLLVGVVGGFTAFCGDDGRSKNHADEGQSDDDVVHGKVPQAASENRPQVNHRRPVRKNQYN